MIPLALLLAAEEPPPTELVAVSASVDGKFASVETRWVLDGPGFPVARVQILDLATGAVVEDSRVVTDPTNASMGLDGVIAAARLQAKPTLDRLKIEMVLSPIPCAASGCGSRSGCTGGVLLPVEMSEASVEGETCPQGWQGTTPTVRLGGTVVSTPLDRPACARSWQAASAYVASGGAVLVLGYEVPGHEGPAPRFVAVAGAAQ